MEGSKVKYLKGILFYLVLIGMLIGVFFFTRNENETGAPRQFLGFSAMRVLTGSMQSEIPQDSLIITRQVLPWEIQVGDDITFMVSETRTVTHRVVGIDENFQGTGNLGFQTQGIENPSPDREIVRPENVVGRVVWHSLPLGQIFYVIQSNVLYLGIGLILSIILIAALSVAITPRSKGEELVKVEEIKAEIYELLGVSVVE
ncbi:MAG: signal peptidase I [Lachnospiraceae bacterium]|nr:signal peptidase I [Lachnospiraceae bacterium]